MTRGRSGLVRAAGAIVALALAACAHSQDTRFYLLTPLAAVEKPLDLSPGTAPVIGLHPVGLPEYLDRPQIVTRVGDNMLQLAEFDQWGWPLRDNVTRVLAEDLTMLLPAERVAVFPWRKDSLVDVEVAVDVTRLEGRLAGDTVLVARWALLAPGRKDAMTTGTCRHTEPAGDGYATLVAAHSRLIGALARDIATALVALPRHNPARR